MQQATAVQIPAAKAARFVDNGDGTVTDTQSGLQWSKGTLNTRGVKHASAEKACAELDLGGHTDWRLPTVEELFLLADRGRFNPAIDVEAFPDTKPSWYWTSTPDASSPGCAWVVDFSDGYAYCNHRDNVAFVRAVRGVPAGQ